MFFYYFYRGKLLLLLSIGFTEGNYCSYFLLALRNNEAVEKEATLEGKKEIICSYWNIFYS